ncbi:hypothetical protein BP5796_11706 [Coleophoma crateriformis]|uniref:RNA polymerase II holoenzyme cyclin-like subunit n=1 Tax=Coleophoma crateriformis TaxID=565419 RepID=A0A3D8QEL4_9HELO|nr:hypothetical protein BP5796_11706 [Coleophoma crateriformis]
MSEDERYRTSTQYRYWSYTPDSLAELRTTTNRIAADRVREAVQSAREAAVVSSAETSETENGSRAATAIQYIKRFYITNSLMTYHPTSILKTALFFATKTENHYFRLTKFADAIGKTTPEDVLASEFLLTQGLRFTFDVRHPFRALEGAVMELQAMANGQIPAADKPWEGREMGKRVKDAHGKAREYLKTSALLTDVYFHFTPSQIMMASLLIADPDLLTWYIGVKLPAEPMREKVMMTLEDCSSILRTVEPTSQPSGDELKELKRLAKKLNKCRNPEKMDLVGLQRAKREGEDGEEEKAIKKRKLEREKSAREGDDLFGPALTKNES